MSIKNKIKNFVNRPELATKQVEKKIGVFRKYQIAKLLRVSRPTLDKRLFDHSWNLEEIKLIINKLHIE